MKSPGIAIIGCGRIGFLLENDPLRYKPCTHYGGACAAGFTPTSACDTNKERLDAFREAAGLDESCCYENHQDLLAQQSPDAVIIATATDSHFQIALDSIRSGTRLIVLEKPVTPSLEQAEILLEESLKTGCRIIVNHERRYDSRYNHVKKMIDDEVIGTITTVNARMLTGRYRGKSFIDEGGGPLLHDGTHLIDVVRYFFGNIASVEGEFTRIDRDSGFEDSAVSWLTMDSGINVFLETGGGRKYFQFELEIWGSDGKILIGNGYEKLFLYEKSALYTGFNDLAEKDFPEIEKNNCFTELYRDAVRILDGEKFPLRSDMEDGLRALETVHGIYYSSSLGRKKIEMPVSSDLIDLHTIFSIDQAKPSS